ncbi:conserved hypothetical protein [Streptomyces viridochromogenes DSM 40736]|uniref:Uncharacterized protein n=1 Tax=Streptomyces viridochromogenes (strain DSM 40736 / JCM 4977 / BCRC 1201 / Tue 494) TaxID=591159 RepID=D9XH50_STRVT|nr:hypothetical protein [Streptomyces viridochromogenes]EFL32843.1 conserved hypothetical protein [Streptomyces viridochromogenes DSM 40736]
MNEEHEEHSEQSAAPQGEPEAQPSQDVPDTPAQAESPAEPEAEPEPESEPEPRRTGESEPQQQDRPEKADPPAQATPATPSEQVHHNSVNQYFYGELSASGAQFGIGTAASDNARRRAVGRLDAGEADAILAPYVKPACFERAALALEQDGVVVLVGPPGTGKRSGAVALVDALADGSEYVVLSPGRSLDDLASGRVAFEKGVGYVLLDRMSDDTSQTADFDWRRVRDTVREHDARLVVTTVHAVDGGVVESVRHVSWELPDLTAVLRVRLVREGCARDTVERAVTRMPDGCRIAEVAAAAERIARGAAPDEVWRDYGSSAAQPVRDWFAQDRTPQEWAEVTTLAFVNGAGYRDFETCQERLESWVRPAFAAPVTEEEQAAAARRAVNRRQSLSHNELVAVEQRKNGPLTRTALVFPHPQYRQWALEELWTRLSTPYWNGVRDWLTELVAAQPGLGLQLSVAQGLALLTRPAFDEVADNYLHPWAGGAAGPAGQSTATLVLQCMCLDESLAATALGLARGWARSYDPVLRSTAAAAFSGALGVRFPTDAVTILLKMIVRRGGLPVDAAFALAGLVAVLAECGQDTGAVFRPLAYRLRAQRETLTGQYKENLLGAALTVLRARDARTGRLVCASLLERDVRRTATIGELWAGVLDNLPRRGRTLAALYATLRELPAVSERPEQVAERFGGAVGEALPPDDGPPLAAALRQVAARADEQTTAVVDIFLTAVLSTEG